MTENERPVSIQAVEVVMDIVKLKETMIDTRARSMAERLKIGMFSDSSLVEEQP